MPYIKPIRRQRILEAEDIEAAIHNAGDLNFVITRLVDSYLNPKHNASYNDYNEVIGVLECVKQELYRRVVAPYEDKKRADNGDVYVE